jgi:hypothetical protein
VHNNDKDTKPGCAGCGALRGRGHAHTEGLACAGAGRGVAPAGAICAGAARVRDQDASPIWLVIYQSRTLDCTLKQKLSYPVRYAMCL